MKQPNFFILGAPKCGTTALAQWLAAHPQVYFSPRKEPHFFNVEGLRAVHTLVEYEALFADAGDDHRAVGEGSTHYLYSREAVPRILEYAPEARFIVCLRNPVEMAPALHGERVSQGRENIGDFERAWRSQAERARGRRIPTTLREDPERLQYGRYCRLGEQLERLFGLAATDRVLPVLLDDVRSDPRAVYTGVLRFLALDDDGREDFGVANAAKRTRWPRMAVVARRLASMKRSLGFEGSLGLGGAVRRLNVQRRDRQALSPALREELAAYFAEDVGRLSALLNRDLSHWVEAEGAKSHGR